jgi:hypothetical protein
MMYSNTGTIIAGDGYAYVPCRIVERGAGAEPDHDHIFLVRVDTNGAAETIHVFDWMDPGGEYTSGTVDLITNGDHGVLVSWTHRENGGDYDEKNSMAIVTGTSVSMINVPQLRKDGQIITPVLQAQDGSFIGVDNRNTPRYMVAFDASGNLRWTVTGYYEPQIATADGGLIARELDPDTGEAIGAVTFDQDGNATGMMDLPTYSWLGNAYEVGSVRQIKAWVVNAADTLWAFFGGNHSGNGTAAREKYAPLKSCPGAATPCPQEAIMSAFNQMKTLLQSPCPGCDTWVFGKIPDADRTSFLKYLSLPPKFWDGTRSYAGADDALCAKDWQHVFGAGCAFGGVPVHDFIGTADAKTQTPSTKGQGVQIFFNPATGICNALSLQVPADSDQGVLNQALLFHEAFHGFMNKDDSFLQSSFHLELTFQTSNITYYIEGRQANKDGKIANVIPGGATGAKVCRN